MMSDTKIDVKTKVGMLLVASVFILMGSYGINYGPPRRVNGIGSEESIIITLYLGEKYSFSDFHWITYSGWWNPGFYKITEVRLQGNMYTVEYVVMKGCKLYLSDKIFQIKSVTKNEIVMEITSSGRSKYG